MLDRLRKTITRYNMLPAGSRVAVAVSGGADSVCLLFALRELAAEFGVSLAVAHFNHKLRGEASDGDEEFVAGLARQCELAFYRAEENVALTPGNLEQAARQARRKFFYSLMTGKRADCVATGHTRDDQAETVLFRILRGSGLTGIAGIHPLSAERIVRPLLDVTREEVEEYLTCRGMAWREDESNRDTLFARNRIRHQLLPQLKREWNPQISASLAQMADLAFEEERRSERQMKDLLALHSKSYAGGWEVSVGLLAELPRATARELIRTAVKQLKGDLRGVDFGHVERVLELAQRKRGQGSLSLPGLTITRSFDWIYLALSTHQQLGGSGAPVDPIQISQPGTFLAPDGTQIHVRELSREEILSAGENGATLGAVDLDLGRGQSAVGGLPVELEGRENRKQLDLELPGLVLRGWRAGDHYCPQGHVTDQKLSDMFQRAKVPSWRRAFWPIVTGGGAILWAKEFGPAAQFAASPETACVLRIAS